MLKYLIPLIITAALIIFTKKLIWIVPLILGYVLTVWIETLDLSRRMSVLLLFGSYAVMYAAVFVVIRLTFATEVIPLLPVAAISLPADSNESVILYIEQPTDIREGEAKPFSITGVVSNCPKRVVDGFLASAAVSCPFWAPGCGLSRIAFTQQLVHGCEYQSLPVNLTPQAVTSSACSQVIRLNATILHPTITLSPANAVEKQFSQPSTKWTFELVPNSLGSQSMMMTIDVKQRTQGCSWRHADEYAYESKLTVGRVTPVDLTSALSFGTALIAFVASSIALVKKAS